MNRPKWINGAVAATWLAMVVGCGASKKADSADEAAAQPSGAWSGSLAAGTAVCISGSAGVRYVLQDALAEMSLELGDDCLGAEVEFEELGEAGTWELKYRAVGEKWQSCKSQDQDRTAFLRECLGSLGATPGAGE